MSTLPFNGRRQPAGERRYQEVVVLVPPYGSNHKAMLKHAQFVNSLGFDAVVFDTTQQNPFLSLPLISSNLKVGLRHVWVDEIEQILNHIVEPKFVYSFSSTSDSALEAIARRNSSDVSAWVCDGGPFFQEIKCMWNLFSHQIEVKNPIFRAAMTAKGLLSLGWIDLHKDMIRDLKILPENFPVLSIRGWQDLLVPPSAIDEVFEHQTHLKYEILSLPEAGHLDGLKKSPEEYKTRVEKFLKTYAHSV
jgi:hypothetical protein